MNKHAMLLLAGFAGPAAAQTAAPASPSPPACEASEHRQFDFWVGRWDVYPTGGGELVAHSLIEKLYAGCGVRENWMPLTGGGGGSLNNYLPDERTWRQTWIDSSNARVDFKGGMIGDAMVLSGFWKGVKGPGQDGLIRMTYTREADGAVRQLGELSTDDGKSWTASFDFTYRPAKEPR